MKKTKVFAYENKNTFVHRLTGVTKLICFLLLSFAAMLSFDIRVLACLLVFCFLIAYISKFSFKRYRLVIGYIIFFLAFNIVLTFFLSWDYGIELFGTRHDLFAIGPFVMTQEFLYYNLVKICKYMSIMPLGFLFFYAIDPSEFASSLNGIKVPYKVCTVFSLALRYFPDIQKDFFNINLAQQARGIDTSKKASMFKRISNYLKTILPLVFSTLDRVELISNAMELRGYGKAKTRTWYSYRSPKRDDAIAIVICALVLIACMVWRFGITKTMYYNPFI